MRAAGLEDETETDAAACCVSSLVRSHRAGERLAICLPTIRRHLIGALWLAVMLRTLAMFCWT